MLSSPVNGSLLGITSTTVSWHEITNWGANCFGGGYRVYLDTNPTPTTLLCSVIPGGTTSCGTSILNNNTTYYWRVQTLNGFSSNYSSTWFFNVKEPVVSGSLFVDNNANSCKDAGESLVDPSNSIAVSLGGTPCTKPTAATFNCVVPAGSGLGLNATSFTPLYSGQTGCTDNACGGNCWLNLSAGDNVTRNIGFTSVPWWQSKNGAVYVGSSLSSVIPNSPLDYDTGLASGKYLCLATDAVVASAGSQDFGPTGGSVSSSGWKLDSYSLSSANYGYSYFKSLLTDKATAFGGGGTGVNAITLTSSGLTDPSSGTTHAVNGTSGSNIFDINGDLTVSDTSALTGTAGTPFVGVFLVSGQVTVNTNDIKPANSYLAFISHGNIAINPLVKEIHGLYLSDGQFDSGVTVNQGLKVVGSLVTYGGARLRRAWTANAKPAEYFVYDPGLMIYLPAILGKSTFKWRQGI